MKFDSYSLCGIFCSAFMRKCCRDHVRRFHMDIKNAGRSREIARIPPLVSVFRQALETFSPPDKSYENFTRNLNKLKSMMNLLKAEDLGLDPIYSDPALWNKKSKAPCTYIEVFKNEDVNMSIFILKPGFKMPLHDHPHMHGLLKVILGSVNIVSYSEYPLTEDEDIVIAQKRAKIEASRLVKGNFKSRKFFAEIATNQTCRSNGDTCVLTPTVSNFHEIEATHLPAAFFDILAPPYDSLIEEIGPRRCRYYKVVNEISSNVVELQEAEVPESFYCDTAKYHGPLLT